MTKLAVLLAAGTLALAGSANANLLVNGSFEEGNYTGPVNEFQTVNAPDSTTITGWEVTGGNVDWVNGLWQASDGVKSIDLNGFVAGTIQQTFTFPSDGVYRLSFDLAGNPADPVTKTLDVRIQETANPDSGFTQPYEFIQSGETFTNMGWVHHTYDILVFGAPITSDIIFTSTTFTSSDPLNPEAYGPAIDNVAIDPVPEPTSLGLLATAGMLLMKRRTR